MAGRHSGFMSQYSLPRATATAAKVGVVLAAGVGCTALTAQYYVASQSQASLVGQTDQAAGQTQQLPDPTIVDGPVTVYRANGDDDGQAEAGDDNGFVRPAPARVQRPPVQVAQRPAPAPVQRPPVQVAPPSTKSHSS